MKPDPDNQLRKRIADALLSDDPSGITDREIERTLEEVERNGEAPELTDIEIGRILLKMRRKLPVGERVPDTEAPAPLPPRVEHRSGVLAKAEEETSGTGEESKVIAKVGWWNSYSGRTAIAAALVVCVSVFMVKLGIVDSPPQGPTSTMPKAFDNSANEAASKDVEEPEFAVTPGADGKGMLANEGPRAPGGAGASGPVESLVESGFHRKMEKKEKHLAREAVPQQNKEFFPVVYHTGDLEGERHVLTDGSILFLNSSSKCVVNDMRRVTLEEGEIFVEVAPRYEEDEDLHSGGATFTVATPEGDVKAFGTKFGVKLSKAGPEVLVTQGTVKADNVNQVIKAGQEMLPGPGKPTSTSRRAAEALHWLQDLDADVNPPAAPQSAFSGGVLIAYDESGLTRRVALKSHHVDVKIENGFATTTVEQTYSSALNTEVEGVFHFPVPPDAAVTRFESSAGEEMVVADLVPRTPARVSYKNAANRGGRPALMEWQDASTFSMRVYPLKPGEDKKVRLTFTRRLDNNYGRTQFRMSGVGDTQFVGNWSAQFRISGGARHLWDSSSHRFDEFREGPDLVLESSAKAGVAYKDIVVNIYDPDNRSVPGSEPKYTTFDSFGPGGRYLLVRYTPELGSADLQEKRDWVFLYETSADRSILEAKTAAGVIKGILEHAGDEDTFSIVAVGAKSRGYHDEFLPVSEKNLAGVTSFLNGIPRLGALNVEAGFSEAARLASSADNPIIVHLGSGFPVIGERNSVTLLNTLPDAPYVGVGIGPRWNRPLMKAAAGRTGGYFTQLDPDEPARWRAFDILSSLNSPRLIDIVVDAPNTGFDFRVFKDTLAHGEELCAIAKLPTGAALPSQIAIRGMKDGKLWQRLIDVSEADKGGSYLADLWARLEIDRLVFYGAGKDEITRVSLTHHVLSPFTSFLVTPDAHRIVANKPASKDDINDLKLAVPEAEETELAATDKAEGAVRIPGIAISPPLPDPTPEPASKPTQKSRPQADEPQPEPEPLVEAEVLPSNPAEPSTVAPGTPRPSKESLSAHTQEEPRPNAGSSPSSVGSRKPGRSSLPAERPSIVKSGSSATESDPEGGEKSPPPAPSAPVPPIATSPEKPDVEAPVDGESSGRVPWLGGIDAPGAETPPSGPGKLSVVEDLAEELDEHLEGKVADNDSDSAKVAAEELLVRIGKALSTTLSPDSPDMVMRGTVEKADISNGTTELDAVRLQKQQRQLGRIMLDFESNEAGKSELQQLVLGSDFNLETTVEFRKRAEISEFDVTEGRNLQLRDSQLHNFYSFTDNWSNRLLYSEPASQNFKFIGPVSGPALDRVAEADPFGAPGSPSSTELSKNELPTDQPGKGKVPDAVTSTNSDIDPESTTEKGSGERKDHLREEQLWKGEPPASGPPTGGLAADSALDPAVDPAGEPSATPPVVSASGPGEVQSGEAGGAADQFSSHANDTSEASQGGIRLENGKKTQESLTEEQRTYLEKLSRRWGDRYLDESADLFDELDALAKSKENLDLKPEEEMKLVEALKQEEDGQNAKSLDDAVSLLTELSDSMPQDKKSREQFEAAIFDLRAKKETTLGYSGGYESAREMLNTGDADGSSMKFAELYRSTVASGVLPPIDRDFSLSFERSDKVAEFHQLIRGAVEQAISINKFEEVVGIAWQCEQVGHRNLADEILERIHLVAPAEKIDAAARVALTIYGKSDDGERTTEVVGLLIRNGSSVKDSQLLRAAAEVAQIAGKRSLAIDWLESALRLDYGDVPDMVEAASVAVRGRGVRTLDEAVLQNQGLEESATTRFRQEPNGELSQAVSEVELIREDYGNLLQLFKESAAAMKTLEVSAPRGFSQRVVEAAERWRSLDPAPDAACRQATEIFSLIGDDDLAFEYATTPLALAPNDAEGWQQLAEELQQSGMSEKAEAAQKAAYEAEAER